MNESVQAEMKQSVHAAMRESISGSALSWADRLTFCRMAAAPLLIAAALMGALRVFGALSLIGVLTDIADGIVARRLNQTTERGALMDSRADLAFYLAMLIGVIALEPRRALAQWMIAAVIAVAYLLPISIGWLKFRRLTSYHTTLARISLLLLLAAGGVWFFWKSVWPLRIATVVFLLSAIEETAITALLDAPRDNVVHVGRVRRMRKARS